MLPANTPTASAQTLLRESAWLHGLVAHLVREPADVDDVVQDVGLLALQQPGAIRAGRAWLATVARRVIARRRARARLADLSEQAAARPEAAASAHEVVARAEAHRHVVDAVLALAEPYRTAVLLRFFEGRKTGAIAAALGCPVATVRARLTRGLQQLRARLERSLGSRHGWLALFGLGMPVQPVAAVVSTVAAKGVWMGTHAKVGAGVVAALVLGTAVLMWPGSDEARDARAEPVAGATELQAAQAAAATGPRLQESGPAAREPARAAVRAGKTSPVVEEDDPPGPGVLALVIDPSGVPQRGAWIWAATGPVAVVWRTDPATGAQATEVLAGGDARGSGDRDPVDGVRRAWRDDLAARARSAAAPAPTPAMTSARRLATTDHRGLCRVVLSQSTVLVATTADGQVSSYVAWSSDDRTDVLTFVAAEGFGLRVAVLDPDRKPAAHAEVHIRLRPRDGGAGAQEQECTIAADERGFGACRLPAPASYGVTASRADQHSHVVLVDADVGGAMRRELCLRPAMTVVGQVLDPYGAPCDGATVRALASQPASRSTAAATLRAWSESYAAVGTTDRDGRYLLDLPSEGEITVSASHPQYAPAMPQTVSISAAVMRAKAQFRLGLWRTMLGEVRWLDGRAIEGAEVSVQPSVAYRASAGSQVSRVFIGKSALYELGHLLPDITYDVTCTPDPGRPHTRVVRTNVPGTTQSFTIDPAALRGGSVALRLQDAAGEPLAGAAHFTLQRRVPGVGVVSGRRESALLADGVLAIAGLEPGGDYAALVEVDGFAPALAPGFTAGKQRELTLTMQRGARLTVRARLPGGRAARSATVTVWSASSTSAKEIDPQVTHTLRTDRNGLATFSNLTPGRWFVDAGYTAERQKRKGREVQLEPSGTSEVTLDVR